jgi:hypothetical protein
VVVRATRVPVPVVGGILRRLQRIGMEAKWTRLTITMTDDGSMECGRRVFVQFNGDMSRP